MIESITFKDKSLNNELQNVEQKYILNKNKIFMWKKLMWTKEGQLPTDRYDRRKDWKSINEKFTDFLQHKERASTHLHCTINML